MTILKTSSIIILLTGLFACQTQNVTIRYEGRVVERYQVDRKTKVRNGYYRVYHSNRKVALEHTYVNGELEGIEKIYHENGAISGLLPMKDGKYDGHFTYYYLDGSVKQKGYYKNDKITGDLTSYYRNGQTKECVRMENNLEEGPFREYSVDGILIKQGNYTSLDGQEALEHGLIYEYDPTTMKLLNKKRCSQGYCCSVWERERGYLRPSTSLCDEIMNPQTKNINSTTSGSE